jgi:hypothetical protein
MRARARSRRFAHSSDSFERSVQAAPIAEAKLSASRGGTTHPVSPNMNAESPTSVTMFGVADSMVSATTFGNASPPELANM